MELQKYHGLGNDYLIYDPKINDLPLNPERIRRICDRNFGAGSDGILFGPVFGPQGRPGVRIFNPDGSEAEKSGNGVRIFSRYLKDAGYIGESAFTLHTPGGDVEVEYLSADGALMRVEMGKTTCRSIEIPVTGPDREVIGEPMTFGGREYRATCVSIGNPHCVLPMEEISREQACALGPLVESAACFPRRINLQLLKVLDRRNIRIEIYERGAGYTLASGTSSCAAATAAYRLGLVEPELTVHMPGGTLSIEIRPDSTVYMTGRVESVGTMRLSQPFIDSLEAMK